MQLVELRFGRNVKVTNEPMADGVWAQFRRAAQDSLDNMAIRLQSETPAELQQWTEVHLGRGSWTDETTGAEVSEESAVVVLFTDGDLQGLDSAFAAIAADLAARFEQDAVAVVFGRSLLVGGR